MFPPLLLSSSSLPPLLLLSSSCFITTPHYYWRVDTVGEIWVTVLTSVWFPSRTTASCWPLADGGMEERLRKRERETQRWGESFIWIIKKKTCGKVDGKKKVREVQERGTRSRSLDETHKSKEVEKMDGREQKSWKTITRINEERDVRTDEEDQVKVKLEI